MRASTQKTQEKRTGFECFRIRLKNSVLVLARHSDPDDLYALQTLGGGNDFAL